MEDKIMKTFLFRLSVIKYNIINFLKKNTFGVVSEYGKVDRIGFNVKEDERESWYIDKIKYKFGKPTLIKRYWDIEDFKNDKNNNKSRIVVRGFTNRSF